MIQPTNKIPEKSEIEIVATLKTKTVSGKSTLTYHLGKDEESNRWLRAWCSTGTGYFSNEYLLIPRIIEILANQNGAPFTSFVFQSLFKGKSVNTPGFLVAILLAEKVIALDAGKRRLLSATILIFCHIYYSIGKGKVLLCGSCVWKKDR